MSLSRVFLSVLLFSIFPAVAQDVSWTPPAVYAEKLKSRLTPVEPLLKAAAHPGEKDGDGVVLVDEELQLILPDARRIIIEHMALLAVTDAAAESLGRAERHFQKSRHRLHLAEAQTILPDGKKQPVKKEGAFIQTPQRESDAALYDDSAELVIIFPNVKAGCVTEWITVLEETGSRMPGEYSSLLDLAGGWPVRKLVRRVEMPDAIASRMKMTPLGSGVPEAQRSSAEGQITFLWERSNVPGLHPEAGRAPLDQTGPCVFLTTLPDWNAFLRWYVPLADKRAVLDDKLKALAEEWTKDAKSPRESVDLLTAKVANDVRYVGLEFNECDLEPHSAAEVWEHQYGDCKDKASLLVALLRHKGLTAYTALVNTEHLGRVEKRSPDYRHFNHAIAVAMLPEGPLFIDATISGAPAGVLSSYDTDREVLLVKEPEQWLRTPAQRAGQYGLDFEAALAADGSLSGWVTLRAGGYIGSLYAEYERTGTKDQVRQRLSRQAASRWEGTSVVDVKPGKRDAAAGTYELSGYFTTPASGSLTLMFPCPAGILPDAGDPVQRETDLTVWLEDLVTVSTIVLPEGYSAELPSPVVISNNFAEGRAAWEKTGKGLKATLEYKPKTARIAAADVAAFDRMLTPLRAWLAKPLTVSISDKARARMAKPGEDELPGFPVLPTGEGQLNLVEEKFPEEGNKTLRRKALEKTLTLFPQDKTTQFKGTVHLAWLDVLDKKHKEALRRLKAPLETGRGAVDAEEFSWAEYVQGIALREDGQKEESLNLFERLGKDEALSVWRRSWALYQTALIHRTPDQPKAVQALQSALALAAGNEDELFQLLAMCRLDKDEAAALGSDLNGWMEKKPSRIAMVLTNLANLATSRVESNPKHAAAILTILDAAGDPETFGEEFAAALTEARSASQAVGATGEIAKQLKTFLEENAALLPDVKVPDTFADAAAFSKELQKIIENDSDGAKALRWTLEFLRRYPPDATFSSHLRKAAAFENYREEAAGKDKPGRLLQQLLTLAERLPKSDDQYWECRLLRGKILLRSGKFPEARKLYAAIAADESVGDAFRAAALIRTGEGAVKVGDAAAALEAWTAMKQFPHVYATADCFLKAALLELERTRFAEARQWIAALRDLEDEVREKCSLAAQVKSLLEAAGDQEELEKWWRFSKSWWPKWEAMAKKIDPSPPSGGLTIPAIASLKELGVEVGTAFRQGKPSAYRAGLSTLAHAARWDPAMAMEFVALTMYGPQIGLDKYAEEYSALCLAMTADTSMLPSAKVRKLLFYRIKVGVDAKGYDSLFADAARFRALPSEYDRFAEVVARFRALTAVREKKELAEATAEMEQVMEKSEEKADRHINVSLLADLYNALGRKEDAVKLIADNLEHPDIKANEAALKELTAHRDALSGGEDLETGLTSAIKGWFAAYQPDWLESAKPAKIEDMKDAGELSELLSISGVANAPQSFKLATLVAADPAQSPELRLDALQFLAYHSVAFAPDEKTARAWTAALADKSLPAPKRGVLLHLAAMGAYDEEAFSFVHWIVTDPVFASSRDRLTNSGAAAVYEFCALAPADLDPAEKAVEKIMSRPLNALSISVLQRLTVRLAGSGREEAARKIVTTLPKVKFEDKNNDKTSLQLSLNKIIARSVDLKPVHDALRAWWVKEFPEAPGPVPPVFERSREPNLDTAEELAWLDAQARVRPSDPLALDIWFDLLRAMPGSADQQESRRLSLLEVFLTTVKTDADRSRVLLQGSAACDMDNPVTVKGLRALVLPLRKLSGAPQSADAIRTMDLRLDLRAGKGAPADWRLVLRGIKTPQSLAFIRMAVMHAITARQDVDGLREYLNTLPASLLTEDFWISESIRAWRAAGMKDEAEIGEAKARELLPDLITSAWALENLSHASRAFRIAQALEDPALLPAPFTAAMEKNTADRLERARFTADVATLRGEWEKAREAAAVLAAERPMDYHSRLTLGRALLKLGRKSEAVPHLKAYVDTSPDEMDWPEANLLLKEAQAP